MSNSNRSLSGVETNKIDIGFKVFTLDTSNIKTWDGVLKEGETTEHQIKNFIDNSVDNIKPNRTKEDVVTEILLKYGLELTISTQEIQLKGGTINSSG